MIVQKNRAIAFLLCFIMLFSVAGSYLTTAAIDTGKVASLTIQYWCKGEPATPVPNAQLTAYRVASIDDGGYTLIEPYTNSGVDINNITNKDDVANTLYNIAQQNAVAGITQFTNSTGVTKFTHLELGMYIVAQTADLEGYTTITPLLISVPSLDNDVWNYNVTALPKTERYNPPTPEETVDIPVRKIWDDENNAHGVRPESVSITLYQNGEAYSSASLNADNEWTYTFQKVPKNAVYTVKENTVANYNATYSGDAENGFTVVNKYFSPNTETTTESTTEATTQPTTTEATTSGGSSGGGGGGGGGNTTQTDITVTKIWDDENDVHKIRPDKITVQLVRNNEIYRTAELSKLNDWKYKFTNVPKYVSTYTVKEVAVKDYVATYKTVSSTAFEITNKYSPGGGISNPPDPVDPKKTNIYVDKIWQDNGSSGNTRPESVTINLLKDGSKYDSVVLSAENRWSYTFEKVPIDGSYTVEEEKVAGYTPTYSGNPTAGFTVINVLDSIEPIEPTEGTTAVAENTTEANTEVATEIKTEIITTDETEIPTIEEEDSEATTNPLLFAPEPTIPFTANIPVGKIWDDNNNSAGARPEEVIVQLIRDGSVYGILSLNEKNNWHGYFKEVPIDSKYTVIELPTTNYSGSYAGNSTDGYLMTNVYTSSITFVAEPLDATGIKPPEEKDPIITEEERAEKAETPKPTKAPPKISLPQTGMLNWPVPVMGASGIILIIIGLLVSKRKREVDE